MKTFFVCLVVVAGVLAAEQRDKRGLLAPAIAAPFAAPYAAPYAAPFAGPYAVPYAAPYAAPALLAPKVAVAAPAYTAYAAPAIAAPLHTPLLHKTVVSPYAAHAPLVW